jgi:hypothetical protein
MSLQKDLPVNMIDGILLRGLYVLQRVTLSGIGTVHKSNEGRIGAQVNDRTENRQVGVATGIHGSDQGGAFKTSQRIHEGGTLSGLHVQYVFFKKLQTIHQPGNIFLNTTG